MANAWGELTWGINNWGQQSDLNVPVSNPNDEPYGTYPYGENDFGGSAGNLGVSTGSVTVTAEINRGWGRETGWGTLDWGTYTLSVQAPVTGQQLNISQGDESTQISVAPTLSGEQLNWSIGNVDPNPDESLIGQQVNIALGEETISAGANVSVTGQQLNISQGDEEIDNITFATTTGQQFNTSTGSVIVGGIARIFPTGVETGVFEPGNVSFSISGSVLINNDVLPTFTAEGDAQLSTAQAKFGPSSLLLDGTGDFVQSNASDVVQDNFTIEFFAYASNFAQDAYLWDNSLSSQGFAFSLTQFGQLRLIQNNTIIAQTSSSTLINNQWNHFALEQNGGLLNLYINGNRRLQYSTGGDSYPGQSYKIGTNEGETQFFNGYIDEFRSSNIARYADNFTPPTSAFTVDGNTVSLLHFDGANGSTNIVNATGSEIPRLALGVNQGQAQLEALTVVEVSGQQLNTTTGNVTFSISGSVQPTGNRVNIVLGEENIQSWQIVDTGTSVAYTEVTTGSSVSWNEIDTAA
jgi:hypothetical protein